MPAYPSVCPAKNCPTVSFIKGDNHDIPLGKGGKGVVLPPGDVVSIQSDESLPLENGITPNSPLIKGARGLSVNKEVAPTFMVVSCPGGGLWINEEGQLEAETAHGVVKFTRPVAYQEIEGKKVEVDCAYVIHDLEASSVKGTDNGHAQRIPPTDTDNGHDSRYKKQEARCWIYDV